MSSDTVWMGFLFMNDTFPAPVLSPPAQSMTDRMENQLHFPACSTIYTHIHTDTSVWHVQEAQSLTVLPGGDIYIHGGLWEMFLSVFTFLSNILLAIIDLEINC